MATIDVMNSETNAIEPIRFTIVISYTNRINESETVKEFAHGSPLTDDGKLYNEYIETETEGAGLCLNPYESSDEPCSAYAFLHVLPFLCTA